MEHARQPDPTEVLALRHKLRAAGYSPIPLYGKTPPVYGKNNKRKGLDGWQNLQEVTREQIEMWSLTWPDAYNTGVLTRHVPVLDLDILNEEAARAVQDHVCGHYADRGCPLTRIGKPPKRAFPFRTDEPFKKFKVGVTAPSGAVEEIEFLGDGEQLACFGIHPETGRLYRWHGGEPGTIRRDDLPYIREAEARQLVDEIVGLLVGGFGYKRAPERLKKQRKGNGGDAKAGGGAEDWQLLFANVHEGRELHDSLRDLAAKMVKSGMNPGAVVNQLRALMKESNTPQDARWKERYDDIPRLVESAEGLQEETAAPPNPAPASSCSIDELFEVFERWLVLSSRAPVYAVLGAVAANLLPGDPVWLGLVAPPSSAKTEILNSVSTLPFVLQAATVTPAALLSGTPKKQHHATAKGGLLRQIGEFGILALKDFGSILSMRPDAKAEVLAALREIYDGAWTRHLGTEGGKTLSWKGKIGLVFGATGVIDSHYSVIGAMGDRFLLCRLAPEAGQFKCAIKHAGAATGRMRNELAEAVAKLFARPRPDPRRLSEEEFDRLNRIVSLVVRLRGAIDRDRHSREMEAVYGAEGTGRLGLTLDRLLAGLDTLGVERETALDVVEAVAMDSVPPLRRAAFEYLRDHPGKAETSTVAQAINLPTNTVRRALEDLAAYHLVQRTSQGAGKADLWEAPP
jgi:Bifunctional DNA primase/polymerase, N-terminal